MENIRTQKYKILKWRFVQLFYYLNNQSELLVLILKFLISMSLEQAIEGLRKKSVSPHLLQNHSTYKMVGSRSASTETIILKLNYLFCAYSIQYLRYCTVVARKKRHFKSYTRHKSQKMTTLAWQHCSSKRLFQIVLRPIWWNSFCTLCRAPIAVLQLMTADMKVCQCSTELKYIFIQVLFPPLLRRKHCPQ